MQKDIFFYEQEILISIAKIDEYITDMDFEAFCADEKTFDACCMKLQHIGECGIQLSKIVDKQYKNIPFTQMAGFRNQMSHDYAGIDDQIVWQTIQIALPDLRAKLEAAAG